MKRCAELLGGRGKLEVGAHSAPGDLAKVSRPDAAKHAGLVSPALEEEVKTKKSPGHPESLPLFFAVGCFYF